MNLWASSTAAKKLPVAEVLKSPEVLDPNKLTNWFNSSVWALLGLNLLALTLFLGTLLLPQISKILSAWRAYSLEKFERKEKVKAEAAAALQSKKEAAAASAPAASATPAAPAEATPSSSSAAAPAAAKTATPAAKAASTSAPATPAASTAAKPGAPTSGAKTATPLGATSTPTPATAAAPENSAAAADAPAAAEFEPPPPPEMPAPAAEAKPATPEVAPAATVEIPPAQTPAEVAAFTENTEVLEPLATTDVSEKESDEISKMIANAEVAVTAELAKEEQEKEKEKVAEELNKTEAIARPENIEIPPTQTAAPQPAPTAAQPTPAPTLQPLGTATSFDEVLQEVLTAPTDLTEEIPIFDTSSIDQALKEGDPRV